MAEPPRPTVRAAAGVRAVAMLLPALAIADNSAPSARSHGAIDPAPVPGLDLNESARYCEQQPQIGGSAPRVNPAQVIAHRLGATLADDIVQGNAGPIVVDACPLQE